MGVLDDHRPGRKSEYLRLGTRIHPCQRIGVDGLLTQLHVVLGSAQAPKPRVAALDQDVRPVRFTDVAERDEEFDAAEAVVVCVPGCEGGVLAFGIYSGQQPEAGWRGAEEVGGEGAGAPSRQDLLLCR